MASTIVFQCFDKNDKPLLHGKSSVRIHNDWLELSSFSFGNLPAGGNRKSDDSNSVGISFEPVNDVADVIARAMTKGRTFEKAVLKSFRKSAPGHQWYLQVEMADALVDSILTPGKDGSLVNASISYGSVHVVYQDREHALGELDGSGTDDWSYDEE